MTNIQLNARLEKADQSAARGEVLQAEMLYLALLKEWPECTEALVAIANLALHRNDNGRANEFMLKALKTRPKDLSLAVAYAEMLARMDRLADAKVVIREILLRAPDHFHAWLVMGMLHHSSGEQALAVHAWYRAVTYAQKAGHWRDEATTPPHMLDVITRVFDEVRKGQHELFMNSYDALRKEIGAGKLERVDRAVAGYLGEIDVTPPDVRQRPKFLYFPDLPSTPYHDPYLHPWAATLQAAFPKIRADAMRVWNEDQRFEDFLEFTPGTKVEDYLRGDGPRPAWEAFFFYRHGKRFDQHHARCPATSEVLESLDLCRIAGQAPEICFSVLTPGSHIMPHYGVTNTRLVMHLPLVVPNDCALNIVDAGEHHWREGELMMFDDTFQHEAWNRSDKTRIVLLLDCWNPHLSGDERLAVKQLIETISDFERLEATHV